MPFTPFHFGPGVLIKAVFTRSFWLSSFLLSNVLIDLEVLYYLRQRSEPIHRYLHTYPGGLAAGVSAGLCMFVVVRLLQRTLPSEWKRQDQPSTMPAVLRHQWLLQSLLAGILGGVSHVFLDSLMHRDMRPFWPFSDHNAMLGTISLKALHVGLATSGFVGLMLWVLSAATSRGE